MALSLRRRAAVAVVLFLVVLLVNGRRLLRRFGVIAPRRRQASSPQTTKAGADVQRLLVEGKIREALEVAQRLHEKDSRSPEHIAMLALCHTRLRDRAKAEAVLRKGLRYHPLNESLLLQLSQVLELEQNFDGALAEVRKLRRIRPAHIEAAMLEARLLLRQGNHAAARAIYEGIAATNPPSARVLSLIGLCQHNEGALPKAEQSFRQALALSPDDEAACLGLARLLIDGHGRHSSSPTATSPATATAPATKVLSTSTASTSTSSRTAALAEARELIERVLKKVPRHAEARRLHAKCMEANSQK